MQSQAICDARINMFHAKVFTVFCAIAMMLHHESYALSLVSDPASGGVKTKMVKTVTSTSPAASAHDSSNPGGVITVQRNPDGSTITVAKFNGPLSTSVFRNPFYDYARSQDKLLEGGFYQGPLIQLETQAMNPGFLLPNMFSFSSIRPFSYGLHHTGPFLNSFHSPFYGGYPASYPGHEQY